MSNWEKVKLGDISDMCLGKMLDKEKNKGEFQPYLANINVRWGGFDLSNLSEMRFEEDEHERYGLQYGDLVICEGGEPGRCAIWKDKLPNMKFQKALHRVRIRDNYSNEFVYYRFLLAGKNGELDKHFIGSTIKHLTGIGLKDVEFAYPPLPTQQKIAAVLSALDAKIELNARINATLESMAKTLYDYWFVQFKYPTPTAAEAAPPPKTTVLLSFLGEDGRGLVWNDELKRKIPLGWEVKKLGDLIKSDKSGDWGKDKPEGNYIKKVSCIRGTDINGLNGIDTCNPPTRFILGKNTHKILNPHDLIIEISGGAPTQSTGRLGYVTKETMQRFENPLICSNFCKAISLKDEKYFYNFIFHWNMLYDNKIFFGYEGKTSGIKNLLFDSFINSHWVVLPPQELANKFYDFMQEIQAKKQTLLLESQRLRALRDWLLPMLMNGQVTIKT